VVSNNKFARLLGNLIIENAELADTLSNSSLPILLAICDRGNTGVNLKELLDDTGLSDSSLYPYIRKLRARQILFRERGKIFFNEKLRARLYEFINLYREHLIQQEFNIPNNAKIYYQSLKEVVFSMPIEYPGAQRTAFSVYGEYGIELMGPEWFYRVDKLKSNISVSNILLDSLRVAGAKGQESSRRRLYSYLFYRKFANKLKSFRHLDLDLINRIFSGEKLDKSVIINFPSREEIVDKARDYDIKV
jgi:hypothetical protein